MVFVCGYLILGIIGVLLGAVCVEITDEHGNDYPTSAAFIAVLLWLPLLVLNLAGSPRD